jgi:hypothetical protein
MKELKLMAHKSAQVSHHPVLCLMHQRLSPLLLQTLC